MTRATTRKQRARQSPDSASGEWTVPLAVFAALFACAFLWPSEGAINGDGLHLTFLWLAGLAGVFVWDARNVSSESANSQSRSLPGISRGTLSGETLLTLGPGLLLLGIWLSTWNVFRVSGDRRAALNLAFDWTAIVAAAWLCRRLIRHLGCRMSITHLIAGLSVGLAVYGIWQSHVYYAAEGRWYQEQREILDEGTDASAMIRIQREFTRRQIPLAGPARRQFEQRLLNSTEPFGPFALANTLAGVLAVGTVLIGGSLLSSWREGLRSRLSFGLAALAFGIVVWCLILTKSRTGWVGAGTGLAALWLAPRALSATAQQTPFRRLAMVVGSIAAASGLLFTIGLFTGVVDREVLLESPRSLQFRMFYWMGAAGVISDEPLLGAGPGNFRQLYLAHKPVESSESILDPHNVLLDAWCFAGIVGFVGILLVAGSMLRSLTVRQPADESAEAGPVSLKAGLAGCVLAHFGWKWLSGEYFGSQDMLVAAVILFTGCTASTLRRLPWNPVAPGAAGLALLVHLLGAGGLQITVTGFLLLVLAVLAAPTGSQVPGTAGAGGRLRLQKMLTAAGVAAIAAAVLIWGLLPVKSAGLQLAIGQHRLASADPEGALRAFQRGADADRLSATIRQQIVPAASYSLMRRSRPAGGEPMTIPDHEWRLIDDACSDAIRSDERAIGGRLSRARIYQQLVRLTGQSEYIDTSVRDLRDVVRRDPTDASLQVELAVCEQSAGHLAEAQQAAQRALEIESVNQSWGHSDQYLSEDELLSLERIMNGETK